MGKPVKKDKKPSPNPGKKLDKAQDQPVEEATDNQRDFGGLPPRDLKKGLGCG